jgi:hypothetical protein
MVTISNEYANDAGEFFTQHALPPLQMADSLARPSTMRGLRRFGKGVPAPDNEPAMQNLSSEIEIKGSALPGRKWPAEGIALYALLALVTFVSFWRLLRLPYAFDDLDVLKYIGYYRAHQYGFKDLMLLTHNEEGAKTPLVVTDDFVPFPQIPQGGMMLSTLFFTEFPSGDQSVSFSHDLTREQGLRKDALVSEWRNHLSLPPL